MKKYLTPITRSDAPELYPYSVMADNISRAMIMAVEQSLNYHPARGRAAFCTVNVYEIEEVGDTGNPKS